MFTSGYIGVSVKSAEARYRQHKGAARRGSNLPVHKAIRKYGDLIVDTVLVADEEYCYVIEGKLRPTLGIGYNVAIGGVVSPTTGVSPSEETRKKISEANKGKTGRAGPESAMFGKKHSEESKRKMRETSGAKKDWDKNHVSRCAWALSSEMFEWLSINTKRGFKGLGVDFGFTADQVKIIHGKIKSGWNPLNDPDWVEFKSNFTEPLDEYIETYSAVLQKWIETCGHPNKGKKPSSNFFDKAQEWRDSQNFHPWENPSCDREFWLRAEEAYNYLQKNPTHRQKKLADAMGVSVGKPYAMFKKLCEGWLPLEDPAWLAFKEEYTKQQEAASAET